MLTNWGGGGGGGGGGGFIEKVLRKACSTYCLVAFSPLTIIALRKSVSLWAFCVLSGPVSEGNNKSAPGDFKDIATSGAGGLVYSCAWKGA